MEIEFEVRITLPVVIHGKLRKDLVAKAQFYFEESEENQGQFLPQPPFFHAMEYLRESDDEWVFVGSELCEELFKESAVAQAFLTEARIQWEKNLTMAQIAVRFTEDI